ncbi:MAG TPA: hypothetical protein VH022_11575, partial [Candidatus Acidoferrum sp.]|nr:hypothetical protein [Candidatus Acidoferrum sp.]
CSEIFSLLDQPREMEKMMTAARSLATPNAARDIVNLIEEVAPRGTIERGTPARGTPARSTPVTGADQTIRAGSADLGTRGKS